MNKRYNLKTGFQESKELNVISTNYKKDYKTIF